MAVAKALRIYADTSVFGGVFDEEFADASRMLLRQAVEGRIALVVSSIVHNEVMVGPARVADLFRELTRIAEMVEPSERALQLCAAYIEHGVVTPKWETDAMHVAIATVSRCSAIASWNFRHIVHFQKMALYNGVNALMGYAAVAIHSPREVVSYGEDV